MKDSEIKKMQILAGILKEGAEGSSESETSKEQEMKANSANNSLLQVVSDLNRLLQSITYLEEEKSLYSNNIIDEAFATMTKINDALKSKFTSSTESEPKEEEAKKED